MNYPAQAQAPTQTQVDEQKRSADYWDALKKETDAKKAIADAQQSIANAEAAARASLTKAETEAEKAKLDYFKAQLPSIPDPSKYKLAAVNAPNLAATASRLTATETQKLAAAVAVTLTAAIGTLEPKPARPVTLLPDDARARTLIGLSRALRKMLDQADTRLATERSNLEARMAGASVQSFAGAPLALSALGEMVLSYATILRTQYGFATAAQTNLADAVLRPMVYRELLNTADGKAGALRLLEPDAVVVLPDDNNTRPELAKLDALHKTIATVRKTIADAAAKVKELRAAAPSLGDEKKKEALKQADEIETRAKQVEGAVEEVNKALAALYVADAQGNTPLESAIRGGVLADTLKDGKSSFLLTLKAAASDVDTVAESRFFSGLYVAVASNTVVHWRLTSLEGLVVSAGAQNESTSYQQVPLP